MTRVVRIGESGSRSIATNTPGFRTSPDSFVVPPGKPQRLPYGKNIPMPGFSDRLTKDERAKADILFAQARVVIVLRACAWLAAVWLTYDSGLPGFGFGLALVWFVGLAKPEFPPDLAKKLDRE